MSTDSENIQRKKANNYTLCDNFHRPPRKSWLDGYFADLFSIACGKKRNVFGFELCFTEANNKRQRIHAHESMEYNTTSDLCWAQNAGNLSPIEEDTFFGTKHPAPVRVRAHAVELVFYVAVFIPSPRRPSISSAVCIRIPLPGFMFAFASRDSAESSGPAFSYLDE